MTDYIEYLGQVLQHYTCDYPTDFSLFPIIYQGKEASTQIDTLLVQLIQKTNELEIENNHLRILFNPDTKPNSTLSTMVDQLNSFASEVTRVAHKVGGTWKEITYNVNTMAATDGDFTRFITVEASGEIDSLKTKINQMVYTLRC